MYFIVEDCPKGLCNSMWAGLNIYAYCVEYGYSVTVPALKKHQNLFDLNKFFLPNQLTPHNNLYINKRPWYLNKFFLNIVGIKFKQIIDSFSFMEKLFNIRRIKSWKEIAENNSNKYFIKNRDFIRTNIFPQSNKIKKMNSLFLNDKTYILGIHLRGGDYRYWRNGKYFFNENLFINYISKYLEQDVNRKCFVATNEKKLSEILVNNFGKKIIIGGDEITDLWGLANSNWIIGPPSTFSMFASFWKNTPLKIILASEDFNDLSMPKDYIIALNIFLSGKRLIDQNGIDFKLK